MLTSPDVSSLVIDRLCDQAQGQNVAVACFYFDFAAQREQPSTSMLGALLKQVVSGLEEVLGGIAKAYEKQKNGHRWAGTGTFGYFEDAADYLFRKAYIHMHRRSG